MPLICEGRESNGLGLMNWDGLHLLRPWWLLGLLPLGLLVWRLRLRGRGTGIWEGVCDTHLLPHLLVGGGRELRYPLVLLGIAWLIAVLALAGPAWSKLPQPVYRGQSALVLILELSPSMDAADLRPSRLDRAKFKLLDILKRTREGQTALVVYADDAFVVSPLTDDADTIAAMVPTLSTDLMPVQGDQPARAIRIANELLTQAGVRAGDILLIGDGSATQTAALDAARELRTKGRRLSVLGVGTTEGAPVKLDDGGFLTDATGAIVIPKLDQDELRRLSKTGAGGYATVSVDDRDLESLLDDRSRPNATEMVEDDVRTTARWREEGPWLVLALVPLAALGFRRGWLALVVLSIGAIPPPSYALDWDDLWLRSDQRAARDLEAGNTDEAARRFDDPNWRGAAFYRGGKFEQATESFTHTDTPTAHYNRGNSLARQGQLQDALAAYDKTLEQIPSHADALHNRKLVEDLIRQQQQQEQQEQSGDDESNEPSPSQQSESGNGNGDEPAPPSDGQDSQGGASDEEPPAGSEPQARDESGTQARDPDRADDGEPREPEQAQSTNAEPQDPSEPADGDMNTAQASAETADENTESDQALQQWLRRIPDDPGGLLRRKFLLEHRRRQMRQN